MRLALLGTRDQQDARVQLAGGRSQPARGMQCPKTGPDPFGGKGRSGRFGAVGSFSSTKPALRQTSVRSRVQKLQRTPVSLWGAVGRWLPQAQPRRACIVSRCFRRPPLGDSGEMTVRAIAPERGRRAGARMSPPARSMAFSIAEPCGGETRPRPRRIFSIRHCCASAMEPRRHGIARPCAVSGEIRETRASTQGNGHAGARIISFDANRRWLFFARWRTHLNLIAAWLALSLEKRGATRLPKS